MSNIPEHILNAVRGYLMDIRSGSHTVGNMRYFASGRGGGGHPDDLPPSWAELPDDAHVTKSMHAEVLYRAFKRAERELEEGRG